MSSERRSGPWALLERSGIYDGLQWLVGAELWRRAVVLDHAQPKAGERVLDLGCGTGALRRYVHDADYVGIDRNADYIDTARSKYPSPDRWILSDVADLAAVEAGTFDVALGGGLLHHLDDATAIGMLNDTLMLLKPGGRIAMIDPVLIERQNPIARKLAELDRGRHVRHPDGYASLFDGRFEKVEVVVRDDLLRLPYNHAITTAISPSVD